MRRVLPCVAMIAVAGACSYAVPDIADVPDNPTYERDVKPLLADHCLLCHSSPPNRGATNAFRLDRYGITDGVTGAQAYAEAVLNAVQSKRMPPAAKAGDGMGPNGLRLLQNWVERGVAER